jgi:hypothetical protein
VEVNFGSELSMLIRETKYLDRMGFTIPEIALNVALQQEKYHQWVEGLTNTLDHYYQVRGHAVVQRVVLACLTVPVHNVCCVQQWPHAQPTFGPLAVFDVHHAADSQVPRIQPVHSFKEAGMHVPGAHRSCRSGAYARCMHRGYTPVCGSRAAGHTLHCHSVPMWTTLGALQVIGQLTTVEKQLMAVKLQELERSLDPGFSPLNWNSLAIPEFIAGCNKAITEFQSLVNQVQKNSSIIEQVINNIVNSAIVLPPPTGTQQQQQQRLVGHGLNWGYNGNNGHQTLASEREAENHHPPNQVVR